MEQLEFDCRLESERELEENVNIALEFACKRATREYDIRAAMKAIRAIAGAWKTF